MKLSIAVPTLLALALSPLQGGLAFQPTPRNNVSPRRTLSTSSLQMSTPSSPEEMRRIMEEEANNPATMAESAERMKNMTPEDMSKLIAEMENMDPVQKDQLKVRINSLFDFSHLS